MSIVNQGNDSPRPDRGSQPAPGGVPEKQKAKLADNASETDVQLFHQIQILPIRLRDLPEAGGPKESTGIRGKQNEENGTSHQSTLDRWVQQLTTTTDSQHPRPGSEWKDAGAFFPVESAGQTTVVGETEHEQTYARMRFAEYVYFHPFVRSFLYTTPEDRLHNRQSGKTGEDEFANRSMRVLKHAGVRKPGSNKLQPIQWARVSVPDNVDSQAEQIGERDSQIELENRPVTFKTYDLRVRRIELYLFETRIGFLVIEFDNREGPLSSKAILRFDRQRDDERCDWMRRPFDIGLGTSPVGNSSGEPPGIKLSDVLTLQDALRRIYPPYWEFNIHRSVRARQSDSGNKANRITDGLVPGKIIDSLQWLDSDGDIVFGGSSDDGSQRMHPCDVSNVIESTREHGEPPLMKWWSDLFGPMLRQMSAAEQLEWLERQSSGSDDSTAGNSKGATLPGEVTATRNSANDDSSVGMEAARLRFLLLGDDRMGVMTYVAVENPQTIADGDWMRLTFADGASDNSERLPYSPYLFEPQCSDEKVFANFSRDYTYDRFFHPPSAAPNGQSTHYKTDPHYQTRFLCSGMTFVAVGSSQAFVPKTDTGDLKLLDSKAELSRDRFVGRPFFIDPVNGALGDFRYHYFKTALIAHFHRATLLNFEDELSAAVSGLIGRRDDESDIDGIDKSVRTAFTKQVSRLRRELLKFRCRFWFTEVTGQEQGQELYELWSRHLNTHELFDQVCAQLSEAEEILERWDAKTRNLAAEKQNELEKKRQTAEQQRNSQLQKAERDRQELLETIAVVGLPIAFVGLLPDNLKGSRAVGVCSLLTVGLILIVLHRWKATPDEEGTHNTKRNSHDEDFEKSADRSRPVRFGQTVFHEFWYSKGEYPSVHIWTLRVSILIAVIAFGMGLSSPDQRNRPEPATVSEESSSTSLNESAQSPRAEPSAESNVPAVSVTTVNQKTDESAGGGNLPEPVERRPAPPELPTD